MLTTDCYYRYAADKQALFEFIEDSDEDIQDDFSLDIVASRFEPSSDWVGKRVPRYS